VTDRQTDGQTEFSSLDRVCIPCSAVKMLAINIINSIKMPLHTYNASQKRLTFSGYNCVTPIDLIFLEGDLYMQNGETFS